MTPLAARILDCLQSSRVALAANDIGQRLDAPIREVMIALYELEQSGAVVAKIRGAKQRTFYEVA